jgi:hypothetical protein
MPKVKRRKLSCRLLKFKAGVTSTTEIVPNDILRENGVIIKSSAERVKDLILTDIMQNVNITFAYI